MKNLASRNENLDIPRMDDLKAEKQTLNYTVAAALAKLVVGETLGIAFGKLAKAVDELITHLSDDVRHITAAERTAWNSKAAGNHTHSAATQAANGLMSAADKKKLDGVAASANNYSLPLASASVRGGAKIGYAANGKNYPVQLSNEQMFVNVPWTDTNTVYTHPTASGNKHIPSGVSSGQILRWSADGTAVWGADNNTTYSNFVKSGSGAKAGLVPSPGTTAGTTKYLREDGTWQVPPNTNTTYANMTGATASAAGKAGLVPAPAAGKQTSFLRGDGTWVIPTNTTYSNMTAATASAAGKAGLVPAPAAGAQAKYLRGDGTWQTPPNTTYNAATQSANGLMSAADKKKLDGGYVVKSDSNGLYVEI